MDPLYQDPANDLLKKYLQGECSPEETRFIEEWYEGLMLSDRDILAEDPAFAAYAENRLHSHLAGLAPGGSAHPSGMAPTEFKKQNPFRLKRLVPFLAAASLAGGILLTIGVFYFSGRSVRHHLSGELVTTARAQLKKVSLPDGSEVWINQLSSLKWTSDFNGKDTVRLVQLSGEGRFKVVSDPSRPFVVQTGHHTYTRVLGTEFNVEAYADEEEIRVSLLSGKVQFGEQPGNRDSGNSDPGNKGPGNRGPVILQPGTMCTYSPADHDCQIMPIGSLEVDGWIKGAIVFNEVPLQEAIHRLALRYDWEVSWHTKERAGGLPGTLKSSAAARPANATVTAIFRHETPEQILAGIAFTNGFRFSLKNKKLVIY
jgi:ferric-dicitrate binding protein FerR (iron transport regulator)